MFWYGLYVYSYLCSVEKQFFYNGAGFLYMVFYLFCHFDQLFQMIIINFEFNHNLQYHLHRLHLRSFLQFSHKPFPTYALDLYSIFHMDSSYSVAQQPVAELDLDTVAYS